MDIFQQDNTDIILLESHYFPSLEYFVLLLESNHILIEAFENYQKQSFRNRCYILTSQKVDKLIIPIINPHKKTYIKDIKIDNLSYWKKQHWRSICTSYSNAPYFIYYEEKLNNILFKDYRFLIDLNLELLKLILDIIGLKKTISLTNKYLYPSKISTQNNNIKDYRGIISPSSYLNKNYSFKNRSIYKEIRYIQTFSKDFIPNLSIIDLIMCQGPNSLEILKKSKFK